MRSPLARQLAAPRVQQRTFIAARNLIRAGAARAAPVTAPAQQQVRGVKTIDFAGVKEDVYGMLKMQLTRTTSNWLTSGCLI
jgi:ketol-acid reductoisomerase